MIKHVFTCGDINGIGPEICVKTFAKILKFKTRLIYFACPQNVFYKALDTTKTDIPFKLMRNNISPETGLINLIDIGKGNINPGKITKNSGELSYRSLSTALSLIKSESADILITAPISKTAIQKAGFKFPGHTEYLASQANTTKFLMVFLSKKLVCSLATIHVPHKNVSKILTEKMLIEKLRIFAHSLKYDLGIQSPKIAVLGLNPHAGESGSIGHEEDKIIIPAVQKNKNLGFYGPFVPDAFFGNGSFKNFDALVGMYHDQVLIPFKMMSFNKGVNFTAGLPFIRTSPDHGTAFDIAWQNKADESSMFHAVKWAEKIFKNRMC